MEVNQHIDVSIKYNLKSTKVFEQYFELLIIYRRNLKHDRVALIMQVGEFYEIYGMKYTSVDRSNLATDINGNVFERDNLVGTMWDFAEDLSLSIAKKTNTFAYGNKSIEVHMAGVPVLTLDKYINTAVETFGWTVVLVEQDTTLDDIMGTKKIIRWESMVISPGTNTFTSKNSNTLMIIYLERIKSLRTGENILYAGISWLDSLTGECGTVQYPQNSGTITCNDAIIYDEIIHQLTTHNPSEVLVYTHGLLLSKAELMNQLHLHYRNHKIVTNDPEFIKKHGTKEYQNHIYSSVFKTSIDGHGLQLSDFPHARIALNMILEYVRTRNPHLLDKMEKPNIQINMRGQLVLANNALEQLNIINDMQQQRRTLLGGHPSVYDIMKRTKTAMGGRLFKHRLMTPITDSKELDSRYAAIANMMANGGSKNMTTLCEHLAAISIDIKRVERQLARGSFLIQWLPRLADSLRAFIKLNAHLEYTKLLEPLSTDTITELKDWLSRIETTFNLDACVDPVSRIETNIYRQGIHVSLDDIQHQIEGDSGVLGDLKNVLTDIVGGNKEVIFMAQNTQYGHYVYTTPARVQIIKEHFKERKDYLVIGKGLYKIKGEDFTYEVCSKGKVRIILECIKTSGDKLIENTVKLRMETDAKFNEWQSVTYDAHHVLLQRLEEFVAIVDLTQSAATIAIQKKLCRPFLNDDNNTKSFLDARGLRHPIIEEIQKDVPYVANDVAMGEDTSGILLFGVNAVGKSSLMKSIGIAVIMAQAGFYVSADSFRYRPYEYLFTRIQGNDNIYAGMSSFAVEMSEFKVIMKYANANSIILGDELCSGTETLDATALVAAGINKLSERGASFIFATHLHYLSTSKYIMRLKTLKMVHLSVSYDSSKKILIYDRKLLEGSGPSSYGIEVCKAMSMDVDYMELAQQIREELSDSAATIKTSTYNKDKILETCEVCKCSEAVDTHHIKFQCSADNLTGMIDHWHKDSKFNLVGLCKPCHQAVHSTSPTLKIYGYKMTSGGVELDYSWVPIIKMNEPVQENNVDSTIIKHIRDMYGRKLSITQIQSRLRTIYNIKISKKEIEHAITTERV